MVWVVVWIGIATLGLLVLAVPAVRLWAAVRELGREVGRVSDELGAAGLALEQAAERLPRTGKPDRG